MVLTPTQSLSCRGRIQSSRVLSRPRDWWAESGEAPPRLPEPLPLLPERGRARPPPPMTPVAQTQPGSWRMLRKRRLYFRAALEGRWGRVGPTGLGARQGQLRRRRQVALAWELGAVLRGLGVRLWGPGARPRWPAPPFPCPHRPEDALHPHSPLSEGLRIPAPARCVSARLASIPGSLPLRPGPLGWSESGRGPAPRVSPAPPSACGEGSEERRKREGVWRGHREEATDTLSPEDCPRRPRPSGRGRRGGVGGADLGPPLLLSPLTRLSLPGRSGPRAASAAASPPSPALPAPASLRVGGASWAGPGAPACRPGSDPTPRRSPTFGEQLLLAALQGTDLPGQSLLQHL